MPAKSLLSLQERLWSRVERQSSGCWIWRGGAVAGYGVIRDGRNVLKTHRLSYEIANGPIPPGLVVMHSCDMPRCVNPDHLSLGTIRDNNRDRNAKGRSARLVGEQNGNHKLSWDKVRQIRSLLSEGVPRRRIAPMFGVDRRLIQFIAKNQIWCE